MLNIFKYCAKDMLRSRWTWTYAGFFTLIMSALLFIGGGGEKVVISLMNVVLFLVPLITLIYALMYFYQVREYVEVLLAQPVSRTAVFGGYFWGFTTVLGAAAIVGLAVPTLFGYLSIWTLSAWWVLLTATLVLNIIFVACALWLVLKYDNRLRGFGMGLLLWLLLAVVYDGLVLVVLVVFEGYPLETTALALTVINPIDLARIVLIFQMDYSAMMGFTGAVFEKFFGSSWGSLIIAIILVVWTSVPIFLSMRKAKLRDF